MPFRSQAQIEKFRELVKDKKISQAEFDKWMKETPQLHKLPKKLPMSK